MQLARHPALPDQGKGVSYNYMGGKWTGWSPRLAGEESPNSAEQCAG